RLQLVRSGARAEISHRNSDNDKRSAVESFSSRTVDCDSALHPRCRDRHKLVAILFRGERFDVVRPEIAPANARAHAATCDRSPYEPPHVGDFSFLRSQPRSLDLTALSSRVCQRRIQCGRVYRSDPTATDLAKLIFRDNLRDRPRIAVADSIPHESRAQVS